MCKATSVATVQQNHLTRQQITWYIGQFSSIVFNKTSTTPGDHLCWINIYTCQTCMADVHRVTDIHWIAVLEVKNPSMATYWLDITIFHRAKVFMDHYFGVFNCCCFGVRVNKYRLYYLKMQNNLSHAVETIIYQDICKNNISQSWSIRESLFGCLQLILLWCPHQQIQAILLENAKQSLTCCWDHQISRHL